MDQVKTGRLIAECRKEKGLKQRQVAECLEISEKTISKWECGLGMPEVSLMIPLCELLHITANELLTGERLSESEYKEKAEETIMKYASENGMNHPELEEGICTLSIARENEDIKIIQDLEYRMELMKHFPHRDIDIARLTCSNTHGDFVITQMICIDDKEPRNLSGAGSIFYEAAAMVRQSYGRNGE